MPIYKGTNNIVAIYKGTNSIAKIYKGTNLVFTSEEPLPSGFHKSRIIYENEAFNLVYTTCSTSDGSLAADSSSGKWKLGTLGVNSASTSDYNNGLSSKAQDTSKTTFYFPSYHNSQGVIGIGSFAFYTLKNTYPNLEYVEMGEGIEKVGSFAVWYVETDSAAPTDVKPKITLPKTLKEIWPSAFKNIHFPIFKMSNYNYYTQGITDETNSGAKGSRFAGCRINHIIADKASQIEYDYGTDISTGINAISGSVINTNYFDLLEIKGVTKIGNRAFVYLSGTRISIDKTITSIGEQAFHTGTSYSELVFKHSNNDSITFTLNSSNQGPFYNKTARTLTVYTDNQYIHNHDWSTYENATVTFYHLDGTAWS